MRVLLVDDDKFLLDWNATLLARAGFTVDVVQRADEARRLVSERAFDVCVLDMLLPDGDGAKLVGDFARLSPGMKIVVLSAFRGLARPEVLGQPNVASSLTKPANEKALIEAVKEAAGVLPPRGTPTSTPAPVAPPPRPEPTAPPPPKERAPSDPPYRTEAPAAPVMQPLGRVKPGPVRGVGILKKLFGK